jgi:hypothetical protein
MLCLKFRVTNNGQNVEEQKIFKIKQKKHRHKTSFFQNRQHNGNIKIMAKGRIMELWAQNYWYIYIHSKRDFDFMNTITVKIM